MATDAASATDRDEARRRLADRGMLSADGKITAAGREQRDAIEARTDRLAGEVLDDPAEMVDLLDQLAPLAAAVRAGGELPQQNPMGLPG